MCQGQLIVSAGYEEDVLCNRIETRTICLDKSRIVVKGLSHLLCLHFLMGKDRHQGRT
jgi:hypothetical protein